MQKKDLLMGIGACLGGIVFITQARNVDPMSHLLFLGGMVMVLVGIVTISRARISR